eukprot:g42959.t1
MADTISLGPHSSLEHLDNKDISIRLLLIDDSSAFNTIIPNKLNFKLRDLGQIANYDETEFRKEVECLAVWCKDNDLSIKDSKMKELTIDFRKRSGGHAPVCINGAEAEMVKSVPIPTQYGMAGIKVKCAI